MASAISDVLQNPKEESSGGGWFSKLGSYLSDGAHSAVDWIKEKAKNDYDPNNPGIDAAFNKGVLQAGAFIPDAIANLISGTAKKTYQSMYGDNPPDLIPHDPFEAAINSVTGADKIKPENIKGYLPQASYGLGSFMGNLGSTGLASKAIPGLEKAIFGNPAAAGEITPGAASTIAGGVTQAAAQPAINKYSENPITRNTLGLAAALAGGIAGGKMVANTAELPSATAAQSAPIGSPEAKTLAAKQRSLASTDVKSADTLNQITEKQLNDVSDTLQGGEQTTATEVRNAIVAAVKERKIAKNQAYQEGLDELQKQGPQTQPNPGTSQEATLNNNELATIAMPAKPKPATLPLPNTQATIDQLTNEKSAGGDVSKIVRIAKAKIDANKNGSLPQLADTHSDLRTLQDPISGLALGTKQQQAAQQIATAYADDIDAAYPGFKQLNQDYGESARKLGQILDGTSKVTKLADKSPSAVFKQIFEKTDVDTDTHNQLKEALPEPVYQKAADTYLKDVFDRGAETPAHEASEPLVNINNPDGSVTRMSPKQFRKMNDILKSNQATLAETLPAEHQQKVAQVTQAIDQSETGVPTGNYPVDVRTPSKNPGIELGKQNLVTVIPQAINKYAVQPIKTNLDRTEMLTGQSPAQQLVAPIARTGQKIEQSLALNAPTNTPAQQNNTPSTGSQIGLPSIPTPNAPPQKSAMDDVMNSLGIRNQSQAQTQNQKPGSAMDAVMQQIGLRGGQTSQSPSNSNQASPLTNAELDFLSRKVKSGDFKSVANFDQEFKNYQDQQKNNPYQPLMDVLRKRESSNNYANTSNPFGYMGGYQMGAQALEQVGLLKSGASTLGNAILKNPDAWTIPGGLKTFLSNPDLQDQAVQKFMDLNKQALTKAGAINANTPQNVQNGLLAAAHIAGAQGAIRLANRGQNSAPDAFGTTALDYYKMGMGA